MKRILISVAALLCLSSGLAHADSDAETSSRATVTTAYMDTTLQFTATTGDTISFGFLADEVTIYGTTANSDTLTVTFFRSAATINGGTRDALRVVASGGVKVIHSGRTFTCAEGFSGLKGIPKSVTGDAGKFYIIASVTQKR